MEKRSYQEYSYNLDREMAFNVYGHGGKPCLVFPCQNGRYFDYENFGMCQVLAPWIDSGHLQLFCVDSIDGETWSDVNGDPRRRIERHEAWYRYVVDELVPRIRQINGSGEALLTTGCSMGASHCVNFFLRRPDIFDAVIGLSGIYDSRYFFGDYSDELVYANSPVDYMSNLPSGHPYVGLINQNKFIVCVGQGAWEDKMLESTRKLQNACQNCGIHGWFDYWGYDVNHDWPWWKLQLPYFLKSVLGPAF